MSDFAERTSEAMLHHQSNGKLMSKEPPYGYMRDPADPQRVIASEYEQKVILRVAALHKAGNGLCAIARWLSENGYKNRSGNYYWHHQTVKRIIARAKEEGYSKT